MKTLKFLCVFALTMFTIPTLGQDFLNVYFKDGTFKIFHFETIVQLNTSQFDAEGVRHSDYQYQHVVTTYDHFVYDINDIDSIAFTKYNKEVVEDNICDAMDAVFPELVNCENIEDAEKVIDKIKEDKSIEDAWSDGHELHIKIKDWETMSFHFNHNNEVISSINVDDINRQLTKQDNIVKPEGKELKLVIANQQHFDESRRYYVDDWFQPLVQSVNLMKKYNLSATYENSPSLDFFYSDMYKYDIVFVVTHGCCGNGIHSFCTSNQLGIFEKKWYQTYLGIFDTPSREEKLVFKNNYDKLFEKGSIYENAQDHITYGWVEEVRNGEICWVSYTSVFESFFTGFVKQKFSNPNSIMFNVACEALKGSNSLAKAIHNRGLGVFLGYNESNSRGQKGGYHYIYSLINGKSAYQAYLTLDNEYVNDPHPAHLEYEPNDDLDNKYNIFLTPIYTNEINPSSINNVNNKISAKLSGLAITQNHNTISLGFKYGTEKNNLNKNEKCIDNEISATQNETKGNISFEKKIDNLEKGKTYYYCAYSYDDKYYNYGDTLSFKIQSIISDVTVTKASYYPDHYDFNGGKYSFKYNCTVTASINPNGRQIQEWGYVYVDPSGSTAKIPLTEFGTSYADSRYSYCLNTSSGTLTFYGYVKYADDPNYYYEEPQQFAIAYPEGSTLNMSECTFKGTETNVSYQGKNYKYKTAYRYVFKPTGAYWLKVGTYEYGSGWNNWTNLPNYTVSPVDGNNALTVNYYYDDKTFTGDYNVKLKGDDETHGLNYATPQYVNYTYSGSQFTGCNFHNTSNAQAPNLGPVIVDEEEEVYETVIDIVL